MWQLFMSDWRVTKRYNLGLLIFIPISYVINLSGPSIYLWILLSIFLIVFLIEKQNKVVLYLASLPIKRNKIVFSRYLYLVSFIIFSLLLLWLVDFIGHLGLPYLDLPPISFAEIVDLFFLSAFFFSIYIPVFYYFMEFSHALIFFLVSLVCLIYFNAIMEGNPLITFDDSIREFILELFSNQPYLAPIGISLFCLLFSYLFSVLIVRRKDLV